MEFVGIKALMVNGHEPGSHLVVGQSIGSEIVDQVLDFGGRIGPAVGFIADNVVGVQWVTFEICM